MRLDNIYKRILDTELRLHRSGARRHFHCARAHSLPFELTGNGDPSPRTKGNADGGHCQRALGRTRASVSVPGRS